MPVIVIGADTPEGTEVTRFLATPGREVRAFVSDPGIAGELKGLGVKVAIGDVSDESHVGAAALQCFSAVLMTVAAIDDRERSFSRTPQEVLDGWGRAIAEAGVRRGIWVGRFEPGTEWTREQVVVDPSAAALPAKVAALDDARTL